MVDAEPQGEAEEAGQAPEGGSVVEEPEDGDGCYEFLPCSVNGPGLSRSPAPSGASASLGLIRGATTASTLAGGCLVPLRPFLLYSPMFCTIFTLENHRHKIIELEHDVTSE